MKGTKEKNGRKNLNKICIIRHSYYPSDPRVRKEAEALIEKGYSVDVICLRKANERNRDLVNKVNIYRLPITHHRGSELRYIVEYFSFFVFSFITLNFLWLKNKYNVIQVNTMPDLLVFVTVLPKLFGVKVVLDMHEAMPEVYMDKYEVDREEPIIRVLEYIEKLAIRYANCVITVTEQMKQTFVDRGALASKIFVILNVPHDEIFDPTLYQGSYKRKRNEFILTSHGTIIQRYGFDTAIKAIAILKEKIPFVQLKMVGEGEYLPELIKLARHLGIERYVQFTGYIPLEKIPEMIMEADVGLVTLKNSLNWNLTHANKMYEYLAMRKPIVISRSKAVEAYFSESFLMFFEPENEKDLAKKILYLYRHPEKRRELVHNADKLNQEYNWKNERRKYYAIVERHTGRK